MLIIITTVIIVNLMKRKIIEKNKPQERQAMQMKTIAHYQQIDVQTDPEQ